MLSGDYITGVFVGQIKQFDKMFSGTVFPPFADPEAQANKVSQDYWDQKMSEPCGPDGPDDDPSDIADDAHQKSLDFYETMTAMHHTVLNLFAAGVFHLFEQQAGTLLQDWTGTRPKYPFSALEELLKSKNGPAIDVKAAPTWSRVNELRLVANVVKHSEGDSAESDVDVPIITKDALAGKHGEYDVVLANPPFGKKSSVTIVNAAGEQERESLIINRDDFWATTSNKQLNFLQHIFTILKQHGRAAVVLPDNVLFEGGAGETVRRELLKQADVHTLLRLPTGIFYAQGVKANVVFFDRKPAREKPWTETLWIYDLRTNQHFTLKENPLKRSDLDDFVACYNVKNRHERRETERFKPFTYAELTKRDKINLDIFWLKDESLEDSANLPNPHVIALEITQDLEAALEQFATIAEDLER